MDRWVVDASVAAKWYFPEAATEIAQGLIEGSAELIAPDLLHLEVASVAWKRFRRGEIRRGTAADVLTLLLQVPIRVAPARGMLEHAMRLALETGCTVYDCVYLALAVEEDCALLTADRKLFDALQAGPLSARVRWLGDLGGDA